MKARAAWGLILILAAATVTAAVEERTGLYSNPNAPPREALDRLNLKHAWSNHVPMDGRRDGFTSIQFHEKNLLVQTRSGLVSMIDGETGRTVWRTRVGQPYLSTMPLAFNYYGVFVVNGTYLFGLDRETGAMQWQTSLPAGLSAPPVADEDQIFLCMVNTRLYAYKLPRIRQGEVLERRTTAMPDIDASKRPDMPQDRVAPKTYSALGRQAGTDLNTGPQPIRNWDMVARVRLEYAPVFSKTTLFVAAPEETYFGLDKAPEGRLAALEVYRYNTDGVIPVAPAVYEETAYLGCRDANAYAIHIETGRTVWRYSPGTAITRTPAVTDQDAYVTSQREGLARLNRENGEPLWQISRGNQVLHGNPDADRFLAANPKFVYALDRSGRLLVLDRQRGAELSRYDMRDFVFPVTNETTDRLYLAANNGLIVCLHDKEYTDAIRHRGGEERAQNPATVLRDALNKLVTEKKGEQKRTVRDILRELGKRYEVEIRIADRAFRAEKLESVSDREMLMPGADNVPLKDYLGQLLKEVNARFEVIGDSIQVLPARQAPPMAP